MRRFLLSLVVAVGMFAVSGCGDPVVATFRGNGRVKTESFVVGDDWSYEFEGRDSRARIVWVYNAVTDKIAHGDELKKQVDSESHARGGEFYFLVEGDDGPWKIAVRQHSNRID